MRDGLSRRVVRGCTDSSPCYPLVLVDELGSGLKSEVTAITLPLRTMPGGTSRVARRRFSKRGSSSERPRRGDR